MKIRSLRIQQGTLSGLFRRALVACVRLLQLFHRVCIAPFALSGCRFYPSCSEYACQSIQIHGVRALPMIARRLWRCNPWGASGFDPVEPRECAPEQRLSCINNCSKIK